MTRNTTLPPTSFKNITPSDAIEIIPVTRGLWIGTAGDISVQGESDSSPVVLKGASGLIVGRFTKVMATGTTASDIVAVR